MPHITIGGQTIAYTVRHSRRARQVRLRISARAGLEVVIPAGHPAWDIEALLLSRASWILKHYAQAQAAAPPERRFVSGETLLYLGQPVTLDIGSKAGGKRASVRLDGDLLHLRLPPDQPPEAARAALESWYRAQARDYIPRRAAALAALHGFQYQRLTIKGQTTRWGSCSSKGNLNFNWRLMMAPPAAVDYVIIHELCHLRELNHSRRFWALVARYCPDYRHWARWLKTNSARLGF